MIPIKLLPFIPKMTKKIMIQKLLLAWIVKKILKRKKNKIVSQQSTAS